MGAVERAYLLSVPERYDPDGAPMPLVFAYHGLTGTPASLRSYLHVEREASGGAIFVYPAGLRVTSHNGRSTTRWDMRADGADVAFFDALLAHLGDAYCVDLGRVFAVGHSAGAVMTNEMGCHRGNVLRAIAPIAGMPSSSRRCTEAPSVWLTHGTSDPDVAYSYGESTRDRWVAAARCDAIPLATQAPTCQRYTGCDGDARVVFCAHGGDHGPPPFAAREIWRFFMGAAVE